MAAHRSSVVAIEHARRTRAARVQRRRISGYRAYFAAF
jgi:hypothetical protein